MLSSSRLLVMLLLAAWTGNAAGAGLALESAMISRAGGAATILVRLRCPHRYVDHTPSAASSRTRITLASVDDCAQRTGAGRVREASRPPGRELAELEEIEFVSQIAGEGSLTLRFTRPVSIEVRQRGDLHFVAVEVSPTDGAFDAGVSESMVPDSSLPTPAISSTERTPERVRRAEARARRQLNGARATPERGRYVINLESATTPIVAVNPALTEPGDGWQFYRTEVLVAGRTWYRLRLGFFATETDAEQALTALQGIYPRAWVTRIPVTEYGIADAATLPARATGDSMVPAETEEVQTNASASIAMPGIRSMQPAEIETLMNQGRAAMIAEDYPRAVQIYTRVLQEPENPQSAQALEYLALARERNGQKAHAVAQYRHYLELYPESDGASRVSQRLAGLTAPQRAPVAAAAGRSRSRRNGRWNVYGGLSQYYRRDGNQFGDQDRVTSQSSVLSDFDVTASRRGERTRFTSRATMGNLYDLLGENEGPGTDSRIYYLYAELLDDKTGLGARLGRQRLRTAGVLGRFDGAHLSWQWRPTTRLNFLTGFPIDSSDDGVNSERVFYGFSVDLLDIRDLFDLSLFYNTQDVDEIKEREAIGGELRYYDSFRSLIANVDYDVSYGELNNLTMMGTWAFENRLTLNAMLDHRKSPFLGTRNALIGQPVQSLDELLLTFTEDQLRDLAVDRTGEAQAVTVGLSTPLFERFQVNVDVTMSDYKGTVASGGVVEVPDAGTEYYYSLNLIGSGLFKEGDSSIFGLRYADGSNATTTSMYLETRYPVTSGLRIGPRLNLAYREFSRDGSTEWLAAPGLRLLYRFARNYTFELQAGSQWSSRDLDAGSTDYNSYFIYAGYRANF